ncbi:VOC family protein [Mycobacterium hodleri]|uniref:VOC family protein n=1 Tax=Mycolicibacterium hodleri TaxID=49897 RepID=UPI0021F3867E|nr:VOC family protein [Mycolicibacterium hodleri]MCV7135201.1 VOC family protein [Mycolicibacterium hodleri]
MTMTNTIRLASVRIITRDLPRTVGFYELLTGATPNFLTDDFVEFVTPSATLAVTALSRVGFLVGDAVSSGPCSGSIVEFWVDDAEAVFRQLQAAFGDDLDVVQAPTMMPWGNMSIVIRDPNGILVNLYTPVTDDARQLQHNRTPKA